MLSIGYMKGSAEMSSQPLHFVNFNNFKTEIQVKTK